MNLASVLIASALLVMLGTGCGKPRYNHREPLSGQTPDRWAVLQSLSMDRRLEGKILALDPERITERDVRKVLSRGPAPRILTLHGGIPGAGAIMASFSEFLIGMGYPEGKIRQPKDGTTSYSPFDSSEKLAGLIAWHYENEGMRVILVGHSLGGVQIVKVLDELAGVWNDAIPVWNPLIEAAEDRSVIVDPLTGLERPVLGLQVAYASVVGAGGIAMLPPDKWSMLGRLETIPDSVEEFVGFSLGLDLWAWDFPGSRVIYRANGNSRVRNVRLPASYIHLSIPVTAHLAKDERIRDWINAYVPTDEPELTVKFEGSSENILWAADVWHSIKKHWCLEAQRLIRAKRQMRKED